MQGNTVLPFLAAMRCTSILIWICGDAVGRLPASNPFHLSQTSLSMSLSLSLSMPLLLPDCLCKLRRCIQSPEDSRQHISPRHLRERLPVQRVERDVESG